MKHTKREENKGIYHTHKILSTLTVLPKVSENSIQAVLKEFHPE